MGIEFGPHDTILITGTRGTGKTTLLKGIVSYYKKKYGYNVHPLTPKNHEVGRKEIAVLDDYTGWPRKSRRSIEDYMNQASAMLRHINSALVIVTHHPSILPDVFKFTPDRIFIGRTPSNAGHEYVKFWIGKLPQVRDLPDYQFVYKDNKSSQAKLVKTILKNKGLILQVAQLVA